MPVGGLRKPKVPGLVNLGVQIRDLFENFCRAYPGFKQAYLNALAGDVEVQFPGEPALIDELRLEVASLLVRNHPTPDSVDLSMISASPPDTCLKANFIELWAQTGGDPGSRLAPWLQEGAT